MSSHLKVERLILVGVRKNYIIKFKSGVNIVYGDSDTGKSSILEFINYLLGSSSIELADEIVSSVEYAALEININGTPYTVKRSILDKNSLVEVYQCGFDECPNYFPAKYSPNFKTTDAPDGFYSDFLLDSLTIPKIKIKVAPSKLDSKVKRLGFRSLFKYCYLNQDDVGSKHFLDIGNYAKATSNQEVFKFIFNVLDTSISSLESDLSEKTSEHKQIKQKYAAISEFLRDTGHETLIETDDSIGDIDNTIDDLNIELESINSKMISGSESYNDIKSIFDSLALKSKKVSSELSVTEDILDKYSRLKNDYSNDIDKLNSLLIAKQKIGELDSSSSPCPICDSPISIDMDNISFDIESISSLDNEVSSISKRKKNISQMIEIQSSKYKSLSRDKSDYDHDIEKARELLDTENEKMITPYLTERDALIKEIASQTQLRRSYVGNLKIRNQQNTIEKKYNDLQKSIITIKEKLKELKDQAPDIQVTLSDLSDNLRNYLKIVGIDNLHGINVNEKTFTPIIRNKDYVKVTSGGLRTIASIGYMLSIFKHAIQHDIHHPRLLMIDTVGKYLGKTTKVEYLNDTDMQEDMKEGVSDPRKYENIYGYIMKLVNDADLKDLNCQIILVDNDVPESLLDHYEESIVAQYSGLNANGNKAGLIDDV